MHNNSNRTKAEEEAIRKFHEENFPNLVFKEPLVKIKGEVARVPVQPSPLTKGKKD